MKGLAAGSALFAVLVMTGAAGAMGRLPMSGDGHCEGWCVDAAWDWYTWCWFASGMQNPMKLQPADANGNPADGGAVQWNVPFQNQYTPVQEPKYAVDIGPTMRRMQELQQRTGNGGADQYPVEYVRICDVFGTGFFYIPGSDTCLKIGSGNQAEQVEAPRYEATLRVKRSFSYEYEYPQTATPAQTGTGSAIGLSVDYSKICAPYGSGFNYAPGYKSCVKVDLNNQVEQRPVPNDWKITTTFDLSKLSFAPINTPAGGGPVAPQDGKAKTPGTNQPAGRESAFDGEAARELGKILDKSRPKPGTTEPSGQTQATPSPNNSQSGGNATTPGTTQPTTQTSAADSAKQKLDYATQERDALRKQQRADEEAFDQTNAALERAVRNGQSPDSPEVKKLKEQRFMLWVGIGRRGDRLAELADEIPGLEKQVKDSGGKIPTTEQPGQTPQRQADTPKTQPTEGADEPPKLIRPVIASGTGASQTPSVPSAQLSQVATSQSDDGQYINIFVKAKPWTIGDKLPEGLGSAMLALPTRNIPDLPGTKARQDVTDSNYDKDRLQTPIGPNGTGKIQIPYAMRGEYGLLDAKPNTNFTLGVQQPRIVGAYVNMTGKNPDLSAKKLRDGFNVIGYDTLVVGAYSYARLSIAMSADHNADFNDLLDYAWDRERDPAQVAEDECRTKLPAVDLEPTSSTAHNNQLPQASLRLAAVAGKRGGVR